MANDEGLAEQCCTVQIPLFRQGAEYVPTGKYIKLENGEGKDLDVYVTGPEGAETALVGIYDIFGIHNNTLQGADHLAIECGYTIVMPDFFRGKGWKTDNIPPKEGRPAMQAYIQSIGSWDVVKPDLISVVEYLKKEGKLAIGAYGFCFGAKKLAQAAADGVNLFKAVALVHPTNLQKEDGDVMTVPVALIPSGGEDQEVIDAIWEKLLKKSFADHCVRQDFLDCHHGFASARSDWNDPRLAGRAREAYEVMAKFFQTNL